MARPKAIPPTLPLVKPSDAWTCVPTRLMVQVKEAAARDDINVAWKLFLECLEYHFTALSGVPCNLECRKGMVEQRKPSAQVLPGGDAASARLSHAVRRARRLRELAKAWPADLGHRPYRADCLINALCRAEPPSSPWAGRYVDLCPAKLLPLMAEANKECTDLAVVARQCRRDR